MKHNENWRLIEGLCVLRPSSVILILCFLRLDRASTVLKIGTQNFCKIFAFQNRDFSFDPFAIFNDPSRGAHDPSRGAPSQGVRPLKGCAPSRGAPPSRSAPPQGVRPLKGCAPSRGAKVRPLKTRNFHEFSDRANTYVLPRGRTLFALRGTVKYHLHHVWDASCLCLWIHATGWIWPEGEPCLH